MSGKKKDFSVTTYREVRTAGGQLVEFKCVPEDAERIGKCISAPVEEIELPQTGKVCLVGQGGYGRYTRFDIRQHDYAGGGFPGCGGFTEVLEIKNPINGKCAIILHEYRTEEHSVMCYFIEWDCIHNAIDAFKKKWNGLNRDDFSKLPGFRRRVECGRLTPWFYAIGDQEIVGDYAFPEGLQDDPVYTFGRKFVVYVDARQEEKKPVVKTCMGCRIINSRNEYGFKSYRVVHWSDGTVWDESNTYRCGRPPRPIEEADDEDLWAHELRRQLPFLKKGKKIVIHFADGLIFEGAFTQREGPTPKGKYYVLVTLKGKDDNNNPPIEGWVDFVPTPECPTLAKHVLGIFKKHGVVVNSVKIKKRENAEGKEPSLFFVLEGLSGAR